MTIKTLLILASIVLATSLAPITDLWAASTKNKVCYETPTTTYRDGYYTKSGKYVPPKQVKSKKKVCLTN